MIMEPEKYLLLVIGFVFGLLPRVAENRDKESQQKKRALAKLRRILEGLFIELEVQPIIRSVGAIQTLEGFFDLDESWAWRIPCSPPSEPDDFQEIIKEVLEWESNSGNYSISNQVISIKVYIEEAHSLYGALASLSKAGVDIPQRPIDVYDLTIRKLKELCKKLLINVDQLRRPMHKRLYYFCKRMIYRPSDKSIQQ